MGDVSGSGSRPFFAARGGVVHVHEHVDDYGYVHVDVVVHVDVNVHVNGSTDPAAPTAATK